MTLELSQKHLQKLKEQMVNAGFPECPIEFFDIHSLLSKITILDIEKKIEKFRMIDLKKISNKDLSNALMEVLSININGDKHSILFPRFMEYPAKTRFYRVRKINSNDTSIPYNTISKEQDVWNPPVELILQPGRLNKAHESLFISPFTAIEEMKIHEDEKFGLIVYESEFPIKVVMIGFWEDIPELTEEENLKLRMFTHFLHTEFTRDVGFGTEYLYRVSEMITKEYFDFPPKDIQDAWCYPSIATKKHVNVCFRPDIAKDLLRFVGVQFCQIKRFDDVIRIKCNYIATGIDANKKLLYSSVNSDLCRQLFPEIKIEK